MWSLSEHDDGGRGVERRGERSEGAGRGTATIGASSLNGPDQRKAKKWREMGARRSWAGGWCGAAGGLARLLRVSPFYSSDEGGNPLP